MKDRIFAAYSPEAFKKVGYELVDMLAQYLADAQQEKIPVNTHIEPDEQLAFWKNLEADPEHPEILFSEVIKKSIQIHHPRYMGHQVCAPAPMGALASMVSSVLNNGMAIYEMGGPATAMEKVSVDVMLQKVGFETNGDGYLTSGGTLGNLTALLAARQQAVSGDVWENGLKRQLGVMVSSEAHYSVDRACRVMGLGADGIIKIPVDADFRMNTKLLEACYLEAQHKGIEVMAVVGSAPSTSTGMHDDLEAIGAFCKEHDLWFHVDGAHGGAALFSEKYRYLLQGIHLADSIVIDGHKMLMTPALMTFVLYKNKMNSFATFRQKAQYLLEKTGEDDWYNGARRTMECTKLMMGMKFYTLLKIHGEEFFGDFVTRMYDLGRTFAEMIKTRPSFELAVDPDSNIVCFRWISKDLTVDQLNLRNARIRDHILKKGVYYIVQTNLSGLIYLRTTLMNPFTTQPMLVQLLDEIETISKTMNE